MSDVPLVSVIVPYYCGVQYLPELLGSLRSQDYPSERIECILVQNGPEDGLSELVSRDFPWVKVLDPGENVGFVGACNYGAVRAQGAWLAFLNTDMRLHPRWLSELVMAVERHPDACCFGSAVLSWNGKRIDFGGAAMNFLGAGYQPLHGASVSQLPESDVRQLFVCGGATFIRRDVYLEVGGFDEDFWAYYEDVDLGWRLWVLGHEVWLVPKSIVYHHHHGSFSKVGQERTRLLYERNALLAVIKNYEEENLSRVLPAALLLAAKRAFLATGVDASSFRIGRQPPNSVAERGDVFGVRYYVDEVVRTLREDGVLELGRKVWAELGRRFTFGGRAPYGAPRRSAEQTEDGRFAVPPLAVAHILALSDVADLYPSILQKRQWIQAHRRRPDDEIFPLFGMPIAMSFYDSRYHRCLTSLAKAQGIDVMLGELLSSQGSR